MKGKEKGKREREEEIEKKKRKKNKKRISLSLRFTEIELSVFVGGRRKVDPHITSYAWGTKILEFRQTPRGREFSYFEYF